MKKIYNTTDERLEAGKYKGYTIERVIEIDPKYLLNAGLELSDEIYNIINEVMMRKGIR